MKKHLLFLFAALLPMLASAQTKEEIDGIWYDLLSKETKVAAVTSSNGTQYSGSITIPATVTYEGVDYSVTSIGNYAFEDCSSLTAITIPKGVTRIGERAFSYCSSLTAINIPEGVTSINWEAFSGCSSLTTVVLPKSLENIDYEAFANCSELLDVYCYAEEVPSTEADAFDGSYPENVTLHVPASALNAYKSTAPWNSFGKFETIETLVEGITLSQSSATLLVGASLTLTATVTPDDATDKSITWSSSNPSVATVDNTGKVTAIATGTATITATANDGSGVKASCEASVTSTAKVQIDGIWYNLVSKAKVAEVTRSGGTQYSGSITIPATVTYDGVAYSVTSIEDRAFIDCSNLTDITLPEDVTTIGYSAFYGCSRLTSIILPKGVTTIGDKTFFGCSRLTTITISEGSKLTSIGGYAFFCCSSLNAITIPEGMIMIGDYAFSNCSGLTSITITEGSKLTSIGWNAFQNCSSLTAITIPEGVTMIGGGAFYGCSSLTTIVLPKSVKDIYGEAFANCAELTDVYCYAETVPSTYAGVFNGSYPDYATLHVPASALEAYWTTAPWSSFGTIVSLSPSTAKVEIGDIWYNLDAETNEAEVTYRGDNYYDNKYSGSITIPATVNYNGVAYSVTSIEENAFYQCNDLTAITIPEGLTSIGDYAFEGCINLTTITIPEGVTSIGNYAFCVCSLTTITIPESVTSIGYEAFYGCSSLERVTINCENVKNWFSGLSSIKEIVLGEGVTSIGEGAFTGCTGLAAITIPEGVTSIGDYTFRDCYSLTAINIPEGVTSIGSGAFYECWSLTTIVLPKSVKYIYNNAFAGCGELTDVYCHAETVPTTEADAFEESYPGKATLHVPASAINDYKATAPWSEFGSIVALTEEGTAPTEVTITINQYGSGTYCSEYALDFSNVEGLKAYAAAGYDTETGVVTLLRVMTAKAGVGLFIKGEPGEYRVPVIENTSYNSLNMLVGTLTETAVNATSGDGLYANYKYTIKKSDSQPLFYRFTDGSTLGAGKAYLQIPMAWLPQTSEAKSISLRFDEGEGTTDIENSQFTIHNSQLTYDLYGRRVDNPVKGGIYIVNGKKVVVK